MNRKLRFGFDVGEVSIGWSVLDDDTKEIVDLGVRAWDQSVVGKEKTPLNTIRINARNARKTLRRRKHRKERVRNLLVRENVLTKDDIEYLLNNPQTDIFKLRYEALDRKLDKYELARLLIFFSGHRGFKSSDTRGQADAGVIKKALSINKQKMVNKSYRTFGEMLYKDKDFENKKKNSDGDYTVSVDRELIKEEVLYIFEQQIKLGYMITNDFIEKYMKVLESQRPFATGDDILDRVGKCTFEPDEYRCSKNAISFQKFRAYQDISKIKLVDEKLNTRYLTEEEKDIVFQGIFNNKTTQTQFKQVRKLLNISGDITFANINYEKEKETKKFTNVDGYETLKKSFKSVKLDINDFSDEIVDGIAEILTLQKVEGEIVTKLKELDLDDELIEVLKEINFTKFGHLSLKAIRKINVGLAQGMTYDKACDYVGYNFKNEVLDEYKKKLLSGFNKDDIRNMSVYKTCVEFRKVLNALIKKYGSPARIHIESTRDLGKTDKQKVNDTKRQNSNKAINESIIKELTELRGTTEHSPSMILKYKLYKEQNGVCMYSGQSLDLITMLYDNSYAEVDHILPMSRSLDNSMNNKVLVLTTENQNKKNRTPFEYLGDNELLWHQFEQRVLRSTLNKRKKTNLLNKTFKDNEKGFTDRNLHYTSWAINEITRHLKSSLLFEPAYKKQVYEISGSLTAQVRSRLEIYKDREENDLHHAVDAVIVALCDDKTIQSCKQYWESREFKKKCKFEKPYENFNYILDDKLKNVYVSRSEVKKSTGQLFDSTIYGYGGRDGKGAEILTKRISISNIKLDKDKEFNMFNKDANLDVYNTIKESILNLKKGEKLTEVKGKNGLPIKKITTFERLIGGNIRVIKNDNGGFNALKGGDMVRVDIYSKDEKYYSVPVYACDKDRPLQYIEAGKPKHMWKSVDDSFDFEFSLYKNSLILIDDGKSEGICYYNSIHSGLARIIGSDINCKKKEVSKGAKTLKELKKLKIDVLGNITY